MTPPTSQPTPAASLGDDGRYTVRHRQLMTGMKMRIVSVSTPNAKYAVLSDAELMGELELIQEELARRSK